MKRFLRWSLIAFAGLLVVYLITFAILSIQPHVNDADLKPRRASIPDEENAFATLEQAAERIWWPEAKTANIAENVALVDLVKNTNWNTALATKVIANNREALQLLDEAMKRPTVQVPEYQRATDVLPYLSGWRKLAEIAAIRANAEFHAGHEAEAFRQVMNLIRLGRQLQASGGAQIHYLAGSAVKGVGIWRMRDWATRTRLTPPQLAGIIRELGQVPTDGEPLAESLKVEYQVMMTTLLDIRSGRLVVNEDGTLKRYVPIKFLPVYNHGKTRRLFSNATRQLLQCVNVPFCQAKRPDFEKRPGPLKLILGGNVAGEMSYWLHMPAVDLMIAKRCQEDVDLQTTRLLLAMRSYQLKHARLPASLDALAPEFISSVPLDAFNGESLLYSPEPRVIYSVGENLRDDGGNIVREERQRQPLDYGCAVSF